MIDYLAGSFGWKQEFIDHDTNKPVISLVFCQDSSLLNNWADKVQPSEGLVFRNFGDGRSADESVKDFERLAHSLTVSPPPVPIIVTTHRVELMSNDVSRPDCIFVLQQGTFTARPIWTLTHKEIRREHNLQKMWLGGMFD